MKSQMSIITEDQAQNSQIQSETHKREPTQSSEEHKFENIEQALQPLLERITDPSEEIYF